MSKPVPSSHRTSPKQSEQASLFDTVRRAKPQTAKLQTAKLQPAKLQPAKSKPATPKPVKRAATVEVFCTRSGPKRGDPDQSSAFHTKAEAVEFLVNLHGLSHEEARVLKKAMALNLNRKWHGSDRCEIRPVRVCAADAQRLIDNGQA